MLVNGLFKKKLLSLKVNKTVLTNHQNYDNIVQSDELYLTKI